jgi:hypothetical protein
VTGDTLAARRAGIQLATTVIARNVVAATANVDASVGAHAKQLRAHEPNDHHCAAGTNHDSTDSDGERLANHHFCDRPRRSARRHAHADFVTALTDREREDAVQTHGREQQRERGHDAALPPR